MGRDWNRSSVDWSAVAAANEVDPSTLEPVKDTLGALAAAALRLGVCTRAADVIRQQRRALREVGATQAADYLGRALKSIEGAERHAARRFSEAKEASEARERAR